MLPRIRSCGSLTGEAWTALAGVVYQVSFLTLFFLASLTALHVSGHVVYWNASKCFEVHHHCSSSVLQLCFCMPRAARAYIRSRPCHLQMC